MVDFKWHPDESPPFIEEHSKAKLTVLRNYLRAYFDRLGGNFVRDVFKLDLIDGFAGGGTFREDRGVVSGTPLIMLEESEAAKKRLQQRRTKPLKFDFKYYFVDREATHTDHLRKVLNERGHQVNDRRIIVRNSRFEDTAEDIIAEIYRRQPRAGRSIFLLDQTGYSQVALDLVARIFRELPAAEIILTFAADTLINFLSEKPEFVQAVSPLQLTKSDVSDLIQLKGGDGGKALVQRAFRERVRRITGAMYDTPFFIRPIHSRRALWFLHLSRHPTARDVMVQCHWNASNTFEHHGSGDFGMLGWEGLISKTFPLFHFNKFEEQELHQQFLNSMPNELFSLASETPVTIDTMRHMFANRTAARYSDLDSVVLALNREREIEILTSDGRKRSRALKRLSLTDRIAFPSTPLLPGISRRR